MIKTLITLSLKMKKGINSMLIKNTYSIMKDKEHHTETHCRLILKHLSSGKHITQMEALKKFGCMRLGARIFDLKEQGYNIKTTMISKNNKRFAKYQLIK